jgi:hypothetical protein
MKNFNIILSKLFFFIACLTAVVLLNNPVLLAQSFKLNAVSDLQRVFEDGYKLPVIYDTIKLFGIRGEVISGQSALQTKNSLANVTVQISPLKHEKTGTLFPENAVNWNFVGSIPLTKNTPNQPPGSLIRLAPARFPDYLMSEQQINVKGKVSQAIWLTIRIPETAESGNYLGKLTVKSLQGERSIPLCVTVYAITLPSERHLKVTEWYTTGSFEHFHDIKEKYSDAWFAMLSTYAENMAAHRQNVFQVPMNAIDIQQTKEGKLAFDFTRFDQIAQVFWDTKGMDYLETGELTRFGENAWFSSEINLRDFRVNNLESGKQETMAGKDVIPVLIPAFESHLRQKGWLDKTLFHIKDEPSMHNSMAWRDMSAYIHQYGPDLRRIDAIETTNLLNDIEVAVPKLDAWGTWYESYRKAQQNGTELWFYTVGIYQGSLFPNKTIDLPIINSRIMPWLNYRYDATGYLHWGWNQWEENPYQDVGMHIGDGWHVYPVREGVLNSLRWEQMRNGIQDYECFLILENLVKALKDSLGTRAEWIDPKQRGKEIASRVVINHVDHSTDPNVLYQAKKTLIQEILEFNTSPRIYIQTNPLENSTLTYHSSVEVFGWTEPGTRILVNGKELPVSQQGFFLEQFGGDLLDTTKINLSQGIIRVQASNTQGSKEVLRYFGIKY